MIWGEYVLPEGTLTHFLSRQSRRPSIHQLRRQRPFPLAMQGLVEDFSGTLRNRKIIVQFNPLWLTSPKADLSLADQEKFNHAGLVPQFTVQIPCYRADASSRISAILDRKVGYFEWVDHIQNAYYHQRSIARWTLEEDGNEPPAYPNAWRNPFSPMRSGIPTEPINDPQRGPASPRHRAWDTGASAGLGTGAAELIEFEWVSLRRSLQWQAFGARCDVCWAGAIRFLSLSAPSMNTWLLLANDPDTG